jgi:hypothetical protein
LTYSVAIDKVTKQLLGCCPDALGDRGILERAEHALLKRRMASDADRVIIVRGLLLTNSHPAHAQPGEPLFEAEVVVDNRHGGLRDVSGQAHRYAVRPAPSA